MYKREAQEAKERRQWKQATLLMHQWNALKEKELRESGNWPPPPPPPNPVLGMTQQENNVLTAILAELKTINKRLERIEGLPTPKR